MTIQESGEMYLETILILSQTHENVRSIDVAKYMNYSKPSVSRAIGLLRNDGYVNMDSMGHLTLTDSGRELAEKIYDRHKTLSKLLMDIGVSEETAVADACRMEHVISDETLSAIKKHFGLE